MYAAWREKRLDYDKRWNTDPGVQFVVARSYHHPDGMVVGSKLYRIGEIIPKDRFQPHQLRNQYEARNIQLAPEGGSLTASPESPEPPGEAPATSPGLFSTTFGQLREQCRSLGLPTWGNKKQLRERLQTSGP